MANILIPDPIKRNMVYEFAEMVRDRVNSYHGNQRLRVTGFQEYDDGTVETFFEDANGPEHSRLFTLWEPGCDVDGIIDQIIQGLEGTEDL